MGTEKSISECKISLFRAEIARTKSVLTTIIILKGGLRNGMDRKT